MFTVFIVENSHYMDDESPPWKHGEFATWDEAVQAAQAVVERSLQELFNPSLTAEELYRMYLHFGEEPYIVPSDEAKRFSAWEYARERCQDLTR